MSDTQFGLTPQEIEDTTELLAEIEGYPSFLAMVAALITDSVFPGICTNRGCEYTCEVEPDATRCECESCGTPTVVSGLVLAGLI